MLTGFTNSPQNSTGRRDRSRRHTGQLSATLRKQKQRERQKKDGFVRLEILVTDTVAKHLAATAALTGGTTKEEAAFLVTATAARDLREMDALAKKAGELWLRAEPYLAVASYLVAPGSSFRCKDRVLTHAEWQPIQTELFAIRDGLSARRRWDKRRIEDFFRQAAARLKPPTAVKS